MVQKRTDELPKRRGRPRAYDPAQALARAAETFWKAGYAGTSLDELTGNAIHWPTVQNRRALRQIPDDCFVRSGTRVLVLRHRLQRT